MQETQVRSVGQEDLLEKGTATHSSILACRIPWTEEPGGLQSMGSQSQTQLSDSHTHTSHGAGDSPNGQNHDCHTAPGVFSSCWGCLWWVPDVETTCITTRGLSLSALGGEPRETPGSTNGWEQNGMLPTGYEDYTFSMCFITLIWLWHTSEGLTQRTGERARTRVKTKGVPLAPAHASWDLPGGPEVKTLCFHCKRSRFDPSLGN